MTGEAYLQSARIAAIRGPFEEFAKNREAMIKVIKEHRQNVVQIDASQVPNSLLAAASNTWDMALEMGERLA